MLSGFKSMLKMVERQSNIKLIALQYDQGTKYTEIDEYYEEKEIEVKISGAYAKQQNSASERLNLILEERSRAIIAVANLLLDNSL